MSDNQSVKLSLEMSETEISPLIFGHFIEFIENCIVGGVYDPGSPSSDEKGIRQDVLEKAKALRPTILRWPGGTYVNIFHWMDSIGPLNERKKRRNLIWGGDVHVPPAKIELAHKIAALTSAAGLRVSSYGSYFRIGVTPIDAFSDVLATASALGAPLVRVWAYDRYLSQWEGPLWDSLVESTRTIAKMAEKAGVKVCLECHNATLTEDYHGALRFIQVVNHPSLRMYWQPNEHRSHSYNLEAAKALAPYTECIHAFYWDSQRRYPLADGAREWEAYLTVFRKQLPEKRIPILLEFMPDNRTETLSDEAKTLMQLIGTVG